MATSGYSVDLLVNSGTTGTGKRWPGGRAVLLVSGSFGGATVTLDVLGPDGSVYLTIGSGVTTNGTQEVLVPPGVVRATVAGGTPSALYARLVRVPD